MFAAKCFEHGKIITIMYKNEAINHKTNNINQSFAGGLFHNATNLNGKKITHKKLGVDLYKQYKGYSKMMKY